MEASSRPTEVGGQTEAANNAGREIHRHNKMGSVPGLCASPNFTFPPVGRSAGEREEDYFSSKGGVSERPAERSRIESAGPRTDVTDHNRQLHKMVNSSISSLNSDTTVCDSTSSCSGKRNFRNDSIYSTDTLLDDSASTVGQKRIPLNLQLPLMKQKFPSADYELGSEGGTRLSHELFKVKSAIEPSFNLDAISSPPFGSCSGPIAPVSSELTINRENQTYTGGHSASLSGPSTIPSVEPPFLGTRPVVFPSTIDLPTRLRAGAPLRTVPGGASEYKEALEKLAREDATRVELLTSYEARRLIERNASGHDGTANIMVIDIRPFTDYVKSHIRGAINVCLPLTLLKRQNYDLTRCINSLPVSEKCLFEKYLHAHEQRKAICSQLESGAYGEQADRGNSTLPSVLLYDSTGYSSGLFHITKKFVSHNVWSQASIYLLNDPFSDFCAQFRELIEAGTFTPPNANVNGHPIPKLQDTHARFKSTSNLLNFKGSLEEQIASPVLSNFKLPTTPKPTFKLRHNEEFFTDKIDDSDLSLRELERTFGNIPPEGKRALPSWICDSLSRPQKLLQDFNNLERDEKERLLNAFSLNKLSTKIAEETTTPGGSLVLESPTGVPVISSGIEFGHKNRYKDIFLFEHSRVKLNDQTLVTKKEQLCDYINASYITPSNSLRNLTNLDNIKKHMRYIATQGPMSETIGDFWKCVVNHKIPIVISLTSEKENGVTKCSAFWESGTYKSNNNIIKVNLADSFTLGEENKLVLRSFEIEMDNVIHHKVFQIHLLSWPDMGSLLRPNDLLSIIDLNNYIIDRCFDRIEDIPTLIHCSAGCGRTGTLCIIDTLINVMLNNESFELRYDPIYSTVNHFRKQRISMVQNLRQYYLIYETILIFLLNKLSIATRDDVEWHDLTKLGIVQSFIQGFNA